MSPTRWEVSNDNSRRGRISLPSGMWRPAFEAVSLLPCGAVGLHAADTLKASTLRVLLHELSANFDVIL